MQQWTAFCAVTQTVEDLLRFISNEFRAMTQEELLALQAMVRGLLSYTINQGLPFHDDFSNKGFKEHLRLAGNAEEALLAVHFHIAELTKQVSRLELESDVAFVEWFRRMSTGMSGADWLGFLNLSGYYFATQFFYKANLAMSPLKDTNFILSTFVDANLRLANLENAIFVRANLDSANLEGANLKGANLGWADLRYAKLEGADLEGAYLENAILTGTILEKKEG
ncbi:MAG: pentapeptide repeat-containing protein [Candidatus Electrothrix sp. AUS4]|nr:pentapeptide repeat-containing protein [Candidatus Electrothrix sp. AUS4]